MNTNGGSVVDATQKNKVKSISKAEIQVLIDRIEEVRIKIKFTNSTFEKLYLSLLYKQMVESALDKILHEDISRFYT